VEKEKFTPSIVYLAIPLYHQLEMLKKNWKSVAFGVVAGLIRKLISVVLQEQGYITHVIFRKIKTPIVIHLLT